MQPSFERAIPVLPATDTAESLRWWIDVCGFQESFRHGTPPAYAGVHRESVSLHISSFDDKAMGRQVGEQTMVRIAVRGVELFYAEFRERGGTVHPNGALQTKPWGSKEFAAIDPAGVCVTFLEQS
jgi:uncharacterized glyoxalase superfamily protein PhnB